MGGHRALPRIWSAPFCRSGGTLPQNPVFSIRRYAAPGFPGHAERVMACLKKDTTMERRTVLTLMGASAAAMALTACAQQEEGNDIVDIAAGSPDFSTLVAAIQAAGLEETLRGPGPFTVFAPVNSAFDALPAGTLESLLLPENRDQLANILTYHVVPGAITSDQILGQRLQVATVQGQSVDVNGIVGKFGSGVRVNDANVISADIIATNGVIHAIDQVLLPS